MKQFFKFMFASMLGTFLVILLFAFIAFIVFAAAIAGLQSETSKSIAANSVLELKLDYQLQERAVSNPFAGFALTGFRINRRLGLNEVIDNIRKAQFDSDIRGIYLNLNNFLAGGLASVEAIRNQLIEFKKSGKFIYAYGNDISQKAFYLASAADRIYLSPEGSLDFKGLSAELVFFKQTLEKLEIKPQIFQYGKFKSAVEPLKLDKMSPENRTQTEEMLNSIYTNMLGNISKSKNIEFSKLDDISKNMLIRSSADARKYNFVDSLIYFDEVTNIIKQKINFMKSKPLKFVSMEDYNLVEASVSNSSENKIALIYADGEIGSGEGNETTIGTENISDAIRKARMDAGVKAIVMRVNSPGGDALTSDLIWREVTLARKEKPFIVSMGNVAASGGYYISCAADTIVAEPTTITGSIGVFGIINNMESFFKNKLGITFDRVKTGKYSDIGTMSRPLAQEEKVIVQKEVDRIYESFVNKVAAGRKKSFAQIHDIAQGRVWTGLQAKKNGLVDVIGGMNDAIRIAALKAHLKNYYTVEYPKLRGFLQSLLEDFAMETKTGLIQQELGQNYKYLKAIKQLKDLNGIQARMSAEIEIY